MNSNQWTELKRIPIERSSNEIHFVDSAKIEGEFYANNVTCPFCNTIEKFGSSLIRCGSCGLLNCPQTLILENNNQKRFHCANCNHEGFVGGSMTEIKGID